MDFFRGIIRFLSPSSFCDLPIGTLPSSSAGTDDLFLFYHQLWRALQRGSPSPSPSSTRRPPLPPELVRLIFHAASITVPAPLLASASNAIVLRSTGPLVSTVWFFTPPLTDMLLAHIAAVQLATVSCDQGYVSVRDTASYSWFDVGVFHAPPAECLPQAQESEDADNGGAPPGADSSEDSDSDMSEGSYAVSVADSELVARRPAARAAALARDFTWLQHQAGAALQTYFAQQSGERWCFSHANPVAEGHPAWREGRVFYRDDKIFDGVRAGDVLAVRACAHYPAWQNRGEKAEVRVWRWFEPVVAM